MREKPLYILRSTIDANPKPSEALRKYWQWLDVVAAFLFRGRKYDNLRDRQQLTVHESIRRVQGAPELTEEIRSQEYAVPSSK